jgi:hypothetical protein
VAAEHGEEQEETGVRKWLTVPGRLLLIGPTVGTMVLGVGWFEYTIEGMPPGQYPVLLWAAPVLLTGGAFFGLAALVLERLGIRIYRKSA